MTERTTPGATDGDEWDIPLGGLAGLSRVQLERTHLEAAVAELPEDEAVSIWKQLGQDTFPVFETHVQNILNVTVGPRGATQSTDAQRGWVLANADRTSLITLLPSTVVVQTNSYSRYSTSLGDPLRKVLALFTEVTGASVVQRLGLRFINKVADPAAKSPLFWRDHIRKDFVGPLSGELGGLVSNLHQQVQLQLDATATARIQSGVFLEQGAPQRYSFLIDLDVFRDRSLTYDDTVCANLVRQLNRTALALFAHVLSEKYLADLGPVDLDRRKTQ
jgi:uncharacterized protein (TIGR04255 family)